MLEGSRFTVVARRIDELVLSQPKSFRRYVYRELKPDARCHTEQVVQLLQCHCRSLLPVLQYRVDPNTHCISTISEYYDTTLREVVGRRNRCDETELLNTVESLLQLLKDLNQESLKYGMLDMDNVCFYQGEIKLLLGNSKIAKASDETEMERDLRVLGGITAELAACRPLLDNNLEELLQSIEKNYSPKIVSLVRCLCDPVASRREGVWKLLAQQQQPALIDKQQIENAGSSNSPKNGDQKAPQKRQPSSLLVQSNSQQQLDYNLQYFQTKIQRIDDLVNECLKRSKRLIERSENRIK